jgi:trans-aconitate 2-methyltransferase
MTDWDARTYHRLSEPQLAWGRRVAEKLAPRVGERILDIGSGTGRLTAELAAHVPEATVVGLDVSHAMLTEARRDGGQACVAYVRASAVSLPFASSTFDAAFSAATFHWVPDHAVLFEQIHRVLKPGGRLVAQCGGGPNLQRLLDRTHALMDSAAYATFFEGWHDPWHFAGVADTRKRLIAAGFRDANVSLEPAPTTLPDARAFGEFISCVCVRHHIDRLPAGERPRFIAELASAAAHDDPPFTLDYWRLNISGVRGEG